MIIFVVETLKNYLFYDFQTYNTTPLVIDVILNSKFWNSFLLSKINFLSLTKALQLPHSQPLVANILLPTFNSLAVVGSTYIRMYGICLSVYGLFHCLKCHPGSSMWSQMRVLLLLLFLGTE